MRIFAGRKLKLKLKVIFEDHWREPGKNWKRNEKGGRRGGLDLDLGWDTE